MIVAFELGTGVCTSVFSKAAVFSSGIGIREVGILSNFNSRSF